MSVPLKRETLVRMRPLERKALLEQLARLVTTGELRLGDAARLLRSVVLGMDRATFARAVKVSSRAIANLEDDPEGNPTLETLQRVFAPIGAKIGLVFPTMAEPAALDEAGSRLRESLLASLAKVRRKRRTQSTAVRR